MSQARALQALLDELSAHLASGPAGQELLREARRLTAELAALEAEALSDPHTSLGNLRALRLALDREVARARRHERSLAILFLDIDRLKAVNDRHGHLCGSELLRELARRLLGSVRAADQAFRWGGDEFAVLLVETGKLGAQRVAERIQARVRADPFLAGRGLHEPVSVSIGVAAFPEDGADAQAVLHAADSAMYRAKRSGGDAIGV